MTLTELINAGISLVEFFMPGYLIISIFDRFSYSKRDVSLTVLWSVIISLVIRTFYSAISTLFPKLTAPDPVKKLIYIVTALIIGIAFSKLWLNGTIFEPFRKLFHTTQNKDLFDDIIDRERAMNVVLHMKDGREIFGAFRFRDESRDKLYIALLPYSFSDDPRIYERQDNGQKSILAVNLSEAQCVEFIYKDGSKVWEKIKLKDDPASPTDKNTRKSSKELRRELLKEYYGIDAK